MRKETGDKTAAVLWRPPEAGGNGDKLRVNNVYMYVRICVRVYAAPKMKRNRGRIRAEDEGDVLSPVLPFFLFRFLYFSTRLR